MERQEVNREGQTERWVYLNGRVLPRGQAFLDIEDRAAMFGDGVYEVTHYYGGRAFLGDRHVERLRRSMGAIELEEPEEVGRLLEISDELVRRNGTPEAAVYWQVSRGASVRNHLFPGKEVKPTVMVVVYPCKAVDWGAAVPTVKAILYPDERWGHCHIKSLMLLANVLGKNAAAKAGATEAILHRGDVVTEGTSTNVMVVRDGALWTHPANGAILGGVTRSVILELAGEVGMKVKEEAVKVAELAGAQEIILTGSTTQVAAVTMLEGRVVGDGQAGRVAQLLHRAFLDRVRRDCGLGG